MNKSVRTFPNGTFYPLCSYRVQLTDIHPIVSCSNVLLVFKSFNELLEHVIRDLVCSTWKAAHVLQALKSFKSKFLAKNHVSLTYGSVCVFIV